MIFSNFGKNSIKNVIGIIIFWKFFINQFCLEIIFLFLDTSCTPPNQSKQEENYVSLQNVKNKNKFPADLAYSLVILK